MNSNPARPARAALLIVAATLSVSGCGSIGARGSLAPEKHYPYMGVLSDWRTITAPDPFLVAAMIDLPFSVVVDTVLAPIDLLTVLRKEECGRHESVERFSVPMTDLNTLGVMSDRHGKGRMSESGTSHASHGKVAVNRCPVKRILISHPSHAGRGRRSAKRGAPPFDRFGHRVLLPGVPDWRLRRQV